VIAVGYIDSIIIRIILVL